MSGILSCQLRIAQGQKRPPGNYNMSLVSQGKTGSIFFTIK
jgi:hypothetical protein